VGGRKVELDKIDDLSLKIPSSAMEAVSDVPSIKEEEGAPDENQGFLPSILNAGLHESTNPRCGLGNPVLSVMLTDQDEPATYTEVMEGLESKKWLEAMKSEIRSMYDNQV
jgi:hypothetical protein